MDSISIQGYKSFRDIKVSLQPINILIGGNGSGKSNFLSVFQLLGDSYECRLRHTVAIGGGPEKILHKGSDEAEHVSIIFREGKLAYALALIPDGLTVRIENERLGYYSDSNKWIYNSIAKNSEDSELRWYHGDIPCEPIKENLKDLKVFHFHDTELRADLSNSSNIENDIYYLYRSGANVAAMLYNIMNHYPQDYDHIVSNIRSVFPAFEDFYLEPNEVGNLSLKWIDRYSGTIYGPSDLSDGTMRFIAMAVLFLQPKLPKIIVIDEPELGLHPDAIETLSYLIKRAASKGSQVIAATQNPDLISNFKPSDILALDLMDGESYINRLEDKPLERWLHDHTLGDLWKRRIIREGH